MLTVSTGIYRCSRELAAEIADCANLRQVTSADSYDLWQDRQTGGGGCRIVWRGGLAWVSRHAGYPWADVTDVVKDLFRESGAKEVSYVQNPMAG